MGDPRLIKLTDIVVDLSSQPRAKLCDQAIADYAGAMRDGVKFPPIVVFKEETAFKELALADGVKPAMVYRLSHGYHRYHAAKRVGLDEILCEIHMGGWKQAVLYAVGANDSQKSLRRTNADKRRSVEIVLAEKEWAAKSDKWIADACKVSDTYVRNVRKDLKDQENGKIKIKESKAAGGKGKKRGECGQWDSEQGRYVAGAVSSGAGAGDGGGGSTAGSAPAEQGSRYFAERVLRKFESIAEDFNRLVAAALEDQASLKDDAVSEVWRVLEEIRDGAKDMLWKLAEAGTEKKGN